MKNGRLLTILGIAIMILMLASIPLLAACAKPVPTPAPAPAPAPTPAPAPAPAPKEKITLSMVSFLPVTYTSMKYVGVFSDKINERSNGELFIDWKGGPEVIPMFDQPEAVRKGVIDIVAAPTAWSESRVPAGVVLQLSEYTPTEERENGFYDYFNGKVQEGMNSYYLGRVRANGFFYVFTNKKIAEPWELAGTKMGVTPLYVAFAKALQVATVSIEESEYYTATERGLMEGFFFSAQATLDAHLFEVTKYIINHGFYGANNVVLYVNLDAWNKLPAHLQKLMTETMIETEPEMAADYLTLDKQAVQGLLDGGMEPIEFSPRDALWYLDKSGESVWEKAKGLVSEDDYAGLRRFLLK